MDPTYRKSLKIQSHEVNHRGVVRLPEIFTYFQNISTDHSAQYGVPIIDLIKKKVTWVVSRYHVKIVRYPAWRETIEITTWRSGMKRLFATREFEVADTHGGSLMVATGSFMLLDLTTKKALPPGDYFSGYPTKDRMVIPDSFRPLGRVENIDFSVSLRVRRHDLDLNRHVNNARYIEWALESVPDDVFNEFYPSEVEVSFRGEASFGDTVASRCQVLHGESRKSFLHTIVREYDGKELTRLKTVWGISCHDSESEDSR